MFSNTVQAIRLVISKFWITIVEMNNMVLADCHSYSVINSSIVCSFSKLAFNIRTHIHPSHRGINASKGGNVLTDSPIATCFYLQLHLDSFQMEKGRNKMYWNTFWRCSFLYRSRNNTLLLSFNLFCFIVRGREGLWAISFHCGLCGLHNKALSSWLSNGS